MKKIFITIFAAFAIVACNDNILDINPKDRISDAAVWEDANLIRAYQVSLYNVIPHGYIVNMQCKTTDEMISPSSGGAEVIPKGTLTPDNVGNFSRSHWTGGCNLAIWDDAYKYLRRINQFITNMETSTVVMADREQLVAETKFLRAYTYFMLIARYGDVPLVTEAYEFGTEMTFTSNSFDEVLAQIEKDLAEAMPLLPKVLKSSDSNFGRATQAVCQALLSRLYLYAASPLYANGKQSEARWQKAYDATKKFINDYPEYQLYPDYERLFNQPSGTEISEIIFARNFSSTSSHQAPANNMNRRYGAYGGWWGSLGPAQELVDDYDMINGQPAFVWVNGEKQINPNSGYDPQHPYKDRDPRFDASIIHDETTYHGDYFEMWVSEDGTKWGYDNYRQSGDNPQSNYVMRKFMPDDNTPINWQEKYTNPWIIFRLGEIYLNMAEAAFELNKEAECREYINKVRARVGMPGLDNSISGEELRGRLYNERRIELVFEEHRYFDVRRWMIAEEVFNRPGHGMKIVKMNDGTKVYTPEQLLDRKFYPEMYLLPISTSEMRKNEPTLQQTRTWR